MKIIVTFLVLAALLPGHLAPSVNSVDLGRPPLTASQPATMPTIYFKRQCNISSTSDRIVAGDGANIINCNCNNNNNIEWEEGQHQRA